MTDTHSLAEAFHALLRWLGIGIILGIACGTAWIGCFALVSNRARMKRAARRERWKDRRERWREC